MRLINADARVTVYSFDEEHEEYSHDEMTVEQALDFATDEGCPPMIDAIPVSWLNAKMLHGTKDLSVAVWRVLNAWKSRNEQEGGM